MPCLSVPAALSADTFTRYTSFERSSAVWTLRGVNSARGRDEGHLAGDGGAGIGADGGRLPEREARHHRLGHEQVGPGVIQVGDDDERRARRHQLAGVHELLRHHAGAPGPRPGASRRLLSSTAICASTAATRARALSSSSRRAPARTRSSEARATRTRSSALRLRSRARSTRALASSRCFCEPGVGAEQRLEAVEVGLRVADLDVDGGDLARRRVHLRLGLTHVLAAGTGFEQAELRRRRGPLGARPLDLQLGVLGVERRDHVAGLDAVAFVDAKLDDAAADFGRDLHFGGLDVARRRERVRRRRRTAGDGEAGRQQGRRPGGC